MRLVDQYKSNSLGSTEQVSFRARARNLLNRNQGQIPNHETVTGDVQITRPLNTIISNSSALFPIRARSPCAAVRNPRLGDELDLIFATFQRAKL